MASSSNKRVVSKFMPSGHDYEFVDEVPEEFICSICLCPMWRPVQTKCGHRFCKDCLKEANKRKNPPQCPEDRQQLRKQDVFDDKATERRILSLRIMCPSDGCQWLGELGDLKDHECNPASRELKNDQKVKKEKIPKHQTDEQSSLTLVPCVYQRFGCKVMTPRKDMDKHIASSIGNHFNITSERLMLLENENRELKTSQREAEQQYQNLKTNLLKEKDERETIAKQLESLKTTINQKWIKVDKNLKTLNSEKGKVSKEIKELRKQIKNQVDPKTATSKAMDERIERSHSCMQASIDELKQDLDRSEKKIFRLQLDKFNREQNDAKESFFVMIFAVLALCIAIIEKHKNQLTALLDEFIQTR